MEGRKDEQTQSQQHDFEISKPTSCFQTRFWNMWDVCGPGSWKSLFVSNGEIQRCKNMIERKHTTEEEEEEESDDVKWARYVMKATTHPDTGDTIFLPFRMAAHVPCNTMLLLAMLNARTRTQHFVAQAANQAFNAAQFYANRNATNTVDDKTLAVATVGAVSGAMATVSLFDRLIARVQTTNIRPGRLAALKLFMPLVCAAAAKPFQICVMRSDEIGLQSPFNSVSKTGSSYDTNKIGIQVKNFPLSAND